MVQGASLRKGLGEWDKLKDNAMVGGLGSSVDLPGHETFNDQVQSGTMDFLAHRMRLSPRSEEAGILAKLEGQIDTMMSRNYGDIDAVVAKFFDKVEDSAKVEPAELEGTILAIQKIVYVSTTQVTDLYKDAYFADRVQQDEYWAAYRDDELPSKATVADRQAHAYSRSQDSRFFYYYSYLLWNKMDSKLKTLKDLQRTLEFFRSRSQKDKSAW